MASNEAKRSHCRGSGVQQPPGRERKSPHQNPLGRERPEGIVQRLTFALAHPHLGRDVVAMFACASRKQNPTAGSPTRLLQLPVGTRMRSFCGGVNGRVINLLSTLLRTTVILGKPSLTPSHTFTNQMSATLGLELQKRLR